MVSPGTTSRAGQYTPPFHRSVLTLRWPEETYGGNCTPCGRSILNLIEIARTMGDGVDCRHPEGWKGLDCRLCTLVTGGIA